MTELCIDFGGTNIKLGLLHGGSVIASDEFPVTGSGADLTAAEQAAIGMLADTGASVTGVAIALPGVVDRSAGRLVRAHEKYSYLGDLDLRNWARSCFEAPAVIENDARAALVGETTFGCAAGATDAAIVTLGTGIGTAAMMNGQLLRGRHDHAGILGGHVTVDLNAAPCLCGNLGCAESIASAWALEGHLRAHPRFAESTLKAVLQATGSVGIKNVVAVASAESEVAARDVLALFIRVWGAAIVTLCHAYDPEVVIVSGGVMRARDIVLPQLTTYVHTHLWSSSFRPPLVSPDAPELSVLRGLSVLAAAASGRSNAASEPAPAPRRSTSKLE